MKIIPTPNFLVQDLKNLKMGIPTQSTSTIRRVRERKEIWFVGWEILMVDGWPPKLTSKGSLRSTLKISSLRVLLLVSPRHLRGLTTYDEMYSILDEEPTYEEIRNALFQMHPTKASSSYWRFSCHIFSEILGHHWGWGCGFGDFVVEGLYWSFFH